jgi:flagellin
MGLFINTNVMALNAQRNLDVTSQKMGKALEQLSSGLRINRAADDAAGLAISEKMRAQIRSLRQASRNAQDGISMLASAEGALSEVHNILSRMRELTVQAGNSTLSPTDRRAIGEELFTLRNEIDNIAVRGTFNGLSLLTGSLLTTQDTGNSTALVGLSLPTGAAASVASMDVTGLSAGSTYTLTKVDADTISLSDGTTTVNLDNTDGTVGADGTLDLNFTGAIQLSLRVVGAAAKTVDDVFDDLTTKTIVTNAGSGSATFRVGAASTDNVTLAFPDMRAPALGSGGANDIGDLVVDNTSVDTIPLADTLQAAVDAAIDQVSSQRAKMGAAQSQMETAISTLAIGVENLAGSESRIRDADIAEVSSELVARQIMQQAGVAVLSQANTSSQAVLSLLQP